jgi:diadenylate cyclase
MHTVQDLLSSISATNMVDIGIMACLVYFILAWFKGTRAFQILASLILIGLLYLAASSLGLVLTSVLFQYLWAVIIVVLVIVFQPEVRQMLERVSPVRYLGGRPTNGEEKDLSEEVVVAVAELARQRLGALIVFQRFDSLENLILKGKGIDAVFSAELLVSVFAKNGPLHDGAILVQGNRVKEAGCILPLSRDENLSSRYGTRHRAALGLAERTDAVCVVVSEERGEVSLVVGKDISQYKKKGDFRSALRNALEAAPHFQGVSGKGLGPVLLSNWPLKISSLVAASVLWFVVVGPQRSEVGMTVPIQYTDLPAGMEITGKWMDRIDVRVRGSQSGLANMRPGSVRAVVELRGVIPGLNYFRITDKNLQVPPGIKISQIRPSDLQLTIEPESVRKVAVVPSILGDVPEKAKVVISPADVKIKASREELKKVTSATTEPIKIGDLAAKGKIVLPIQIKPDRLKIDSVEPPQVTVTLEPGS